MLGGLAIALWATWPVLSLQTRELPAFESMTLIFVVAWLILTGLPRSKAAEPELDGWADWLPAIAFAAGETGSTIFFLLATQYISAAESNLIIFLWPGITVALSALLGIFRLRVRHVLGIFLGFGGVAVLMGAQLSPSLSGMSLALLGSLSWSLYCVFRLKWPRASASLLRRGFAMCAAACAVLHLLLEPSVVPGVRAALAACIIGIVPTAIANVMWDQGFRRGDSRLLAVMAYATPLGSAVLLTLTGYERYSWRLAIGAAVIVTAGVLSRADSLRSEGPTG